ncbi:MAG: TadE/TadG family type IV pilus assembly protein [Armatimonadota bacterium]|nr:TadE/TadG family type IV pilus assembly protein [Armatimonadota bacterium]
MDERGEITEFALVAPLILLILIGLVNFALAGYASAAAQQAAAFGARRGSVAQANAGAVAVAEAQAMLQHIRVGSYQVRLLAPGGVPGSVLAVEVRWRVPNFFKRFPGLFNRDFEGRAVAFFRQEGW